MQPNIKSVSWMQLSCLSSLLQLFGVQLQVLVQIAIVHVFDDHDPRLVLSAHAQQLHDVFVFQFRQNVHLALEILLGIFVGAFAQRLHRNQLTVAAIARARLLSALH